VHHHFCKKTLKTNFTVSLSFSQIPHCHCHFDISGNAKCHKMFLVALINKLARLSVSYNKRLVD
jgi:hypothetical protein